MSASAKVTDTSAEPFVDNYPPLRDWLRDNDARCLWQIMDPPKGKPRMAIECWRVGVSQAIVMVHRDKRGWEIFTAPNTNKTTETLADAAKRCGL